MVLPLSLGQEPWASGGFVKRGSRAAKAESASSRFTIAIYAERAGTYLWSQFVLVQLLDRRTTNTLFRLLPLCRLIQFQSSMCQVASCAWAVLWASGYFTACIVEFAQERSLCVVEDVDGAGGLRH